MGELVGVNKRERQREKEKKKDKWWDENIKIIEFKWLIMLLLLLLLS